MKRTKKQTHRADNGVIETTIFKSNVSFLRQREQRMKEALTFKKGTAKKPLKHVVSVLPNGKESYFLKPGKEAQRQKPNIHDMFPNVGQGKTSETNNYTFEVIWEHLVEISIINQILFKKVLVLLYRLCFFIDHQTTTSGDIRYLPSPELMEHIEKIDFAVQSGFADKFKKQKIGLLEFLHLIDLLGWNEDVKYHVKNGKPDFNERPKNAGRPNTIISVISVPLMINDFLSNIIENVNYIEKINVRLILSTMQQLSKSRGICVLSHTKLQQYLSPYLIKPNQNTSE